MFFCPLEDRISPNPPLVVTLLNDNLQLCIFTVEFSTSNTNKPAEAVYSFKFVKTISLYMIDESLIETTKKLKFLRFSNV